MKYELDETVVIQASGESGEIIGRAEYSCAEPSYLLRYKCADGCAVENWWTETSLAPVKGA